MMRFMQMTVNTPTDSVMDDAPKDLRLVVVRRTR